LPIAPAPAPVPAVCQVLNANISICGGTAISTPSLSFASCVANMSAVNPAAVIVSSDQDADSLPCQANGTAAVGCYGEAANSTSEESSGKACPNACICLHWCSESYALPAMWLSSTALPWLMMHDCMFAVRSWSANMRNYLPVSLLSSYFAERGLPWHDARWMWHGLTNVSWCRLHQPVLLSI